MNTTDDDSNIATAVLNEEMDIASAVEALGEMTDAELKRELLSAAIVGGATLLERRRSSSGDEDQDDTTAETGQSTAVDVEAVEGESADSDVSPDDEDSGSGLVTLPRLVLLGVAAGGAYAAMKYRRRSQSDTAQSTFEDVTDDVDEETGAGGHEAGLSSEGEETDVGGEETADAGETSTDTDEDDEQ